MDNFFLDVCTFVTLVSFLLTNRYWADGAGPREVTKSASMKIEKMERNIQVRISSCTKKKETMET